jgi:hypothetical protein
MLLTKILGGDLPILLGELDAVGSANPILQDHAFKAYWLPWVEILTKLEIDELVPKGMPFPNPAVMPLVKRLLPIWKAVTGRTAKPISIDRGTSHAYLFADWIREVIKKAGFPEPSNYQVDAIVRSRFKNKKI